MKFLKRVAIILAVLVLVWIVLAFFGPKMIHVERSMVINTEASVPFEQINTLKNWKDWSYWDNIDTVNMKDTWEGPESGVGARHGWDSPDKNVGKGTLTITKSEPNKFVETELNFDGMGTSIGGWKLADTAGGTKVTTYMDMNIGFMMRPMMLFMNMDEMLGNDFEKTLTGLKKKCESMPKGPSYQMVEGDAQVMDYLSVREKVKSVADIGPTLGKLYGEIGEQMKKSKVDFAGPVFAIYHSFSDTAIDMEACVPVTAKVEKTEGRVKFNTSKPGKTVTVDYYGPYEGTEAAHGAIWTWAEKNGKQLEDAPWEIYVTDPGVEKDPNKVLTKIVYYMK
jgi:effector-binding domain-containing protein